MSEQPFEPKPSEELARVAGHFNIDPQAVQKLRAMPLNIEGYEQFLAETDVQPIHIADDELKIVDTSSASSDS